MASFLSRLVGRSAPVAMSSPALAALLAKVFGGGATKSGAYVNERTALEVTAVLSCTRVIAEGVAQVPWMVMRSQPQASGRVQRIPARDHPLWLLLNRKPNRWQTSFAFRETITAHQVIAGNAYVFLSRSAAGRLLELVPIPPSRVRLDVQIDGEIIYWVSGRDGAERPLTRCDIWHLRGLSWDGLVGDSVVRLAREAIGLSMSLEETQAKLQSNGIRVSGTYSVEGSLGPKAYEDLKAWITKEFAGGAAQWMLLDRGAKWHPNTMSMVDAQHHEARGRQIEEICRAMRVLPVMVGHETKSQSYASHEQMQLAHHVHTLMPWYERIEQSTDCALLTDAEMEQGYYTLLDGSALMRGAMRDVAEYLSRLVLTGILTRNEARDFLDRNGLDGLDDPITPVNVFTGPGNPSPSASTGGGS